MSNPVVNTSKSVGNLVRMAVLIAILLVLEATGLGLIKTPWGLELTIMQIPVIIGAILMGPLAGAILGGVFGLISFWECFGLSTFGVTLMGINPFGTFLTCVPTRILMGLCCGLIFKALHAVQTPAVKNGVSFFLASLCGALLNTLFFMSVLVLFFYHTDFIQQIAVSAGASGVLTFVVAFVGIQGLIEAVVCTVVGTIISMALYKAVNH